jgi:hypothetical protein
MATNLVNLSVYQINQKVGVGGLTAQFFAFPTQGFLIQDTTNSPTRSLATGYNVYSCLQSPSGTLYYVRETASQIVTLFNA